MLVKSFEGLVAVNKVNMNIPEENVTGIIGPNGSGKTTLFNLFTGYFSPTEGEIFFGDKDITYMPPYERVGLGLIRTFQLVSVFNSLSVWENLVLSSMKSRENNSKKYNFFFTPARKENIYADCFDALKKVGLEKSAEVSTKALSYGDKRMLEIGISLSLKPKILLLDEPLAGLSDHEIVDVLDLINKIKDKVTIVIIEHKISKVAELVDTFHVMNAGSIICEGPLDEVMANDRVRECYWGKDEENCLE
jgi:branched-chain amino acid transport system ATP-binding protein